MADVASEPAGTSPSEDASARPDGLAIAGRRMWADLRAAVGRAVVGGEETVRLVAIALLADGHVLVEDVPGVGKTLLARAVARALSLDTDAHPGHARPAAVRRHRRQRVRAGQPPLRARSGLHQRPAGRRDQPGDAAHAVGAAGGDAGTPGVGRRDRRVACPTRSWCWRRRTRSSSEGTFTLPRGAAGPLPAARPPRLPGCRGRARGSPAPPGRSGSPRHHRAGGRPRAAARGPRPGPDGSRV